VSAIDPPAIELVDVTKIYRRYGARHLTTLKSAFLQRSLARDLKPAETFTALRGVSFTVRRGQTFGVIGRNGSGKSTALKVIAGITKPTTGTVHVRGRISALIELGAGFHPEISGRENVFINGMMLGLSRGEIRQRFDEIVEFAELRDFIDAPVKTYSSGMYMRLGFAVAIHVDPEVLLVDEVLAVGDEAFTHRCLDKFAEFRRRNRTVLLVTHSLALVERLCDEAVWLDAGRTRAAGDPKRVIAAYVADVERTEGEFLAASDARIREEAQAAPAAPPAHPDDFSKAPEGRWGSREVEVVAVAVLNARGEETHLVQSGEAISIRMTIRARRDVHDFVFGIGIFNLDGVCVYGTNTAIDGLEPDTLSGDAEVRFRIDALSLVEGTYKLDVAVHKRDGVPYDYHRLLYSFRVASPAGDIGIYRPPHRWEIAGGARFRDPSATPRGSGPG
jgi:ABC-type polysaccharide/polyol phosphate transport system ATPase subunit